MGVSKNRGTPKSSILIEFSILNHPFWGTTIFGNTHIAVPSAGCCSSKVGHKSAEHVSIKAANDCCILWKVLQVPNTANTIEFSFIVGSQMQSRHIKVCVKSGTMSKTNGPVSFVNGSLKNGPNSHFFGSYNSSAVRVTGLIFARGVNHGMSLARASVQVIFFPLKFLSNNSIQRKSSDYFFPQNFISGKMLDISFFIILGLSL